LIDFGVGALSFMDRQMFHMFIDHLEVAEKHVSQGRVYIERQRRLVTDLARAGHKTGRSVALLALLEQIQAMHIEDRDRLLRELRESA
jgi:hypothetical protein